MSNEEHPLSSSPLQDDKNHDLSTVSSSNHSATHSISSSHKFSSKIVMPSRRRIHRGKSLAAHHGQVARERKRFQALFLYVSEYTKKFRAPGGGTFAQSQNFRSQVSPQECSNADNVFTNALKFSYRPTV